MNQPAYAAMPCPAESRIRCAPPPYARLLARFRCSDASRDSIAGDGRERGDLVDALREVDRPRQHATS
jgi:hypothetical protein